MADKIVTLKNSDDDSLFPVTQYNCVYDENGNPLPSDFSQIVEQGATLTKPLIVTGGDSANSGKIIITENGHITDTSTTTLFGISGSGTHPLLIGGNSYEMKLRGSQPRVTYKDKALAFTTDISNPNLLINGDFQVNQRGLTTYTEIKKYTVDRWVQREHGTVEILNGGIRVNCTETGQVGINQSLETFSKLFGKTLTLSMKVNAISGSDWILRATSANNSYWHTHPIAEKTSISTIGLHSVTFDFDASSMSNYPLFNVGIFGNCSQGDYIEIEYIKLEVGSVATPLSPKPYGQELLDCMRYYQKIDDLRLNSSLLQSNQIQYSLPLQIPIRGYDETAYPILPTVDFGTLAVQSISGTDQTGFTFSIAFGSTYMLIIKASKTGHGLTTIASATMKGSPTTPMTIDAEIY